MATSDLSDSDLLAKLRAALARDADEVPENHRTRAQWALLWGCSESTADRLIKTGVAKGIMGKQIYRVAIDSGVIKPAPRYYEL